MFTCKIETKQVPERTVHNNMQRRNRVSTENLKQEGNRITKKKQVWEMVKSNDGSLYIKLLAPTATFNALLTHRLHDQFES